VGADPARLEHAEVGAVARAAAEEERFLARYPADDKAKEVRFFLAIDYYRLSRSDRSARGARYVRLGREALELVRTRYPGTMEARTAEALLQNLAVTGKREPR
jgi:outer membrane protein assembly factor BamD (BamD/ComL family)